MWREGRARPAPLLEAASPLLTCAIQPNSGLKDRSRSRYCPQRWRRSGSGPAQVLCLEFAAITTIVIRFRLTDSRVHFRRHHNLRTAGAPGRTTLFSERTNRLRRADRFLRSVDGPWRAARGLEKAACYQRSMTNNSAPALSDAALLAETIRVAETERRSTSQLIALLAEMDTRRLFLGQGYPSLFAWCTQVLHLSESSAYSRITAARAARRLPVHSSAPRRRLSHLDDRQSACGSPDGRESRGATHRRATQEQARCRATGRLSRSAAGCGRVCSSPAGRTRDATTCHVGAWCVRGSSRCGRREPTPLRSRPLSSGARGPRPRD